MAEYINREEVCEKCNNIADCEKEKCPVYKVPTVDAVEVVRCRDCEHGVFERPFNKYICTMSRSDLKFPDDFCSRGKRKLPGRSNSE